jgi:integrase
MSSKPASRNLDIARDARADPATLADVLEIVLRAPGLSATGRRDRASALRTVGRLMCRPLDMLPCDVASVRAILSDVAPARHGLSHGRWTNVSSLVFRSLDLAQVSRLPSRSTTPIAPAWYALLLPLPEQPYRLAIRPFARYCSREGITPEDVDLQVFEGYEQALQNSARAEPRHAYLRLVRAWNTAGTISNAWPAFKVSAATRRRDYSLPWDVFPPSFKEDVDAMVAAVIDPDPFCDSSPKPIKRATAKRRAHTMRALASVLVRKGHDPKSFDSISSLVSVDRVKAALRFIYERGERRKTTNLRNFANHICVVAEHWVGVPDESLVALKAIRSSVDCGPAAMTDKNRATLRCFEDDRLIDAFLAVPERVWRRHRDLDCLKISQAVDLQVALAIEILTVAPVRLGNLSAIRLDRNLIDEGAGRKRRVHLHFPANDVKNGVDLDFPLPSATIALLDCYVEHVRPTLARKGSAYLFPGEGTEHKCGALLSAQIAEMVERQVGVRLTAHQFRHLAGFIYLKSHPGGHEVVRRLLGHKSIETTLRFYAGMEVSAAVRHYDTLIQNRRLTTLPAARTGRREGNHA